MAENDPLVLEKSWTAQTGRVWQIAFEHLRSEADHVYYQFTCECSSEDGRAFIYTPQVSVMLLSELGIDMAVQPKLAMRVTAGQGLEDIKIRLNAGHDRNFNELPYCKTYTKRDADRFRRYLPQS